MLIKIKKIKKYIFIFFIQIKFLLFFKKLSLKNHIINKYQFNYPIPQVDILVPPHLPLKMERNSKMKLKNELMKL